MLAILIALFVQGEIANPNLCGVEDPLMLSEEQRNCVVDLSTKILENGPDFLTIEWPDIVPALAANSHRCVGRLNHNVEPAWPRDDSGAIISIEAPIVVTVSYDVDELGRVHDVTGSINDAALPEETLSQFVSSAEFAVSRWSYATCENHNPAAKGRTTELHFMMDD